MGGGGPSKQHQEEVQKLQDKLNDLDKDLQEQKKRTQKLEAEKQVAEEKAAQKAAEAEKLQREEEELKRAEDELLKQKEELKDELLKQKEELEHKVEEGVKQSVGELKSVAEERDHLKEDLSAAQVEVEQLKNLLPTSEEAEDPQLAVIKQMELRSQELENLLDVLEGETEDLRDEGEKLRSELEEAEAAAVRATEESEALKAEAASAEDRRAHGEEQPQESEARAEASMGEAEEREQRSEEAAAGAPQTEAPDLDRTGQSEARSRVAAPAAVVETLRQQLRKVEAREQETKQRLDTAKEEQTGVRSSLQEFAPDAPGRVAEPSQRGVYLGSLLDFFEANCGETTFERLPTAGRDGHHDDDWRRPLCLATKLARRCHQLNQEKRVDISKKKIRPMSPNTFAVEKLFIRPMTQQKRCSMAEVWNRGEPVQAEMFVSHCWSEDFGDFVQGLLRLAVSRIFIESPALPQDGAAADARNMSVFLHALCNSLWSEEKGIPLQDLAIYKVLSASSTTSICCSVGPEGSALLRAWCDTELFLAKELGKSVVLNTKLGPLQDQSGRSAFGKQLTALLMQVVLPEIDLDRAEASRQQEKSMLVDFVNGTTGSAEGVAAGLPGMAALKKTVERTVSSQCLAILAETGIEYLLKAALDFGGDPDATDGFGVHALTFAVALHGEESGVAKLLLAAKSNPDAASGAADVMNLFSVDQDLRAKAVTALQKLGEKRKIHAAAIDAAKREYARRLVDSRWDELRSDSPQVVVSVLAAIEGIGQLAKPLASGIMPLLAHPNIDVVEAACKVVCCFAAVEDFIDDPDPVVRAAVLRHMGKGGAAASAKWMSTYASSLSDTDMNVRFAASQLLMELGEVAAPLAAQLAAILRDESWYIRLNGLKALAKIGAVAVPYMGDVASLLGDSHNEVRRVAKETLGRLKTLKDSQPAPTAVATPEEPGAAAEPAKESEAAAVLVEPEKVSEAAAVDTELAKEIGDAAELGAEPAKEIGDAAELGAEPAKELGDTSGVGAEPAKELGDTSGVGAEPAKELGDTSGAGAEPAKELDSAAETK